MKNAYWCSISRPAFVRSRSLRSGVFDHDPAVIAVLDQAWFRGRQITIWWYEAEREIRMRPSVTPDHGGELHLAEGDAHALLEGLGLNPDPVGEIPVDAIWGWLANPAIRGWTRSRWDNPHGRTDRAASFDR